MTPTREQIEWLQRAMLAQCRCDSDKQEICVWCQGVSAVDALIAERDETKTEVKSLFWLWTHCRAIGMRKSADKSPDIDSKAMDVALFTVDLRDERESLLSRLAESERDAEARKAIEWVLDDAKYKAPEQWNELSRRWYGRLSTAISQERGEPLALCPDCGNRLDWQSPWCLFPDRHTRGYG